MLQYCALCAHILPHFAMTVYYWKLRQSCDDPVCPDPVRKLSKCSEQPESEEIWAALAPLRPPRPRAFPEGRRQAQDGEAGLRLAFLRSVLTMSICKTSNRGPRIPEAMRVFTSKCPLKVQISQELGIFVQIELLKTGRAAELILAQTLDRDFRDLGQENQPLDLGKWRN